MEKIQNPSLRTSNDSSQVLTKTGTKALEVHSAIMIRSVFSAIAISILVFGLPLTGFTQQSTYEMIHADGDHTVTGDFENGSIGFYKIWDESYPNGDTGASTFFHFISGFSARSGSHVQTVWDYAIDDYSSPKTFYDDKTYDVSNFASYIDNGAASFEFSGWYYTTSSHPDDARIVMNYRDGGGGLIAQFDSGWKSNTDAWREITDSGNIPVGTRQIQLELYVTNQSKSPSVYYDDLTYKITVSNSKPTLSNVTVQGAPRPSETVSTNFDFNDADGDSQMDSYVEWYSYSNANGDGAQLISTGGSSYTLTNSEDGRYVGYKVQAKDPYSWSDLVSSSIIGPVSDNMPPTAENVSISGTQEVGFTLSASYTYSDPEGAPESGTTIQWYRSDDAGGTNKTAISGANGNQYTLVKADLGKYITFEVTPSDGSITGSTEESSATGQIIAPFSGGSGTSADPYQISNITQIELIEFFKNEHFKLVQDIDASATSGWDGGKGFDPIGTAGNEFKGVFDGNDYTISNLTINRPSRNYAGLFGALYDATIKNMVLSNVNIYGNDYVGAIAGSNTSEISNVAVKSGTVKAAGNYVGGIAGRMEDFGPVTTILKNSYAKANVDGNVAGSLVGVTVNHVSISNSYGTGTVTGGTKGGVVGSADGTTPSVSDVFWDTQTTGLGSSSVGTGKTTVELKDPVTYTSTGWNMDAVWAVYSSLNEGYPEFQSLIDNFPPEAQNVSISGTQEVGFTLSSSYNYSDPEGDSESGTSIQWYRADDSAGTNRTAISGATNSDYTVTKDDLGKYITVEITPNDGSVTGNAQESNATNQIITPFSGGSGTEADPYQITNIVQIQKIEFFKSDHFILMSDIDASATSGWNGGKGFMSIGDNNNLFSGSINGDGYVISDLFINRSSRDYVGLIGGTSDDAVIKNLGLENVDITGANATGSIIGYGSGLVTNVFTTGSVQGNSYVGGLAGFYEGINSAIHAEVINAYANVEVTAQDYAGGLIGAIQSGKEIRNTYAVGKVSTSGSAGGLTAFTFGTGFQVYNSFWDIASTDQSTSSEGTGKTTAEMKSSSTFSDSGWDLSTIWARNNAVNNGYPVLRSFVDNFPPVASNVNISGDLSVDAALNGSYTYSDEENDSESGTTYQWYRSDDDQGTNKTAIAGATSQTYTLTTDDADKYISFEVTPHDGKSAGTAVESALSGPVKNLPEITLSGNSTDISDGATTTDAANHTDFGSVQLTGSTQDRTYTITNDGGLDLNLTGDPLVSISGTDSDDFTVTSQPSTGTISSGADVAFTVQFDPSALGARSAEVSIANDDADENPFTFAITGTGVNTPPVITSSATPAADENQTAVLDMQANDGDGGSEDQNVTYAITGGTDQALFTIDTNTGALSFDSAPDFENPADDNSDNQYQVEVTVDDGGAQNNTVAQSLTVTVHDLDEVPVFTSANTATVDENDGSTLLDINANDGDGGSEDAGITYSLSGGDDQTQFAIDAGSGALSLDPAADFENPADANSDNVYEVTVQADDGQQTATQSISVTVTNLNEHTPVITSNEGGDNASLTLDENSTEVTTVSAGDEDANASLTYSISAGADSDKFSIDGSTGDVTFNTAPDAENATDSDTDNVYEVEVQVSDGSKMDTQMLSITIQDVNEATPSITSAASVTIDEQLATGSKVIDVNASDTDLTASLTYSITSNPNADGDKEKAFAIDASSGQVTVNDPDDLDREETVSVSLDVQVSDGSNKDNQTITVNLNDMNEFTPVIAADQSFDLAEDAQNSDVVGTVSGSDQDAESDLQNWTITAGNDEGIFDLGTSSGALVVVDNSSIDYEATTSYTLTLTVDDGTNTSASETVSVNITDVNDNAPVFTSANTASVDENGTTVLTATTTDADTNPSVSYSLTGGADQTEFSIDGATGELTFTSAPDFENPADSDGDNQYEVTITADDGINTTDQTITVTVQDLNDNTPVISSANSVTIDEELAAGSKVIDVQATDADPSDTPSYSITDNPNADGDGEDAFTIDGTNGQVTVNDADDLDRELNANVTIEVSASDGSNTATQTITVNLNDVNEFTPVVTADQTFSIAEDAADGDALGTVVATDQDVTKDFQNWWGNLRESPFSIDAHTGQLTVSDPSQIDYEQTTSYSYNITVADADYQSELEAITITITDVNDNAPEFTSANSASVDENQTAVLTVASSDADSNPSVGYSVTSGSDKARFTIDGSTGELSFTTAPDYENPADRDGDNQYEVTITADDGLNTADQTIIITVNDVNDNTPVISSNANVTIDEELANGSKVIDVNASDADPSDNLSYNIASNPNTDGDGSNAFTIDTSTGQVTVNDSDDLDREQVTNVSMDVEVTDGTNTTDQTITVTLTDVNEFTPVVTADQSFSISEDATNGDAIGMVSGSDEDATTSLQNWKITSGNDEGLFALDASKGALTIADNSTLDYESTTSYSLTLTVGDGTHTSSTETVTITITDVNDNAPVFTSAHSASVDENQTAVLTATSSDADTNPIVSYSVTGGSDQSQFAMDASTGELTFTSAPDYENPTDSDGDNEYEVTITADDGVHTTDQTLTVTVNDLNDNAPVISSTDQVTIDEELSTGSNVIDVNASDADPSDQLTYTLSSNSNPDGDSDEAFSIDGSSGQITVNDSDDLNREAVADLSLEVEVSDGTNTVAQTITVSLQDVNEFDPVFISASEFSIYEFPEQGADVATITATDEDATAILSYSISSNTDQDGDGVNALTLDAGSGKLSVSDPDDFDPALTSSLNLSIEVTDGANTTTQDLAVTILTPPQLSSSDPADQAEAITLDKELNITFDQQVTLADASLITLAAQDGSQVSGLTATASDKTLSIAHDQLSNNTHYTLTIPAGVVQNSDNVDNRNAEITFRTIQAAPSVSATTPGEGATGIAVDQAIAIEFSQSISLADESQISIKDADDHAVNAVSGSVSGTTLKLSHEDFANNTLYTVQVGAGAVENADQVGNETFEMSFTSIKAPPAVAKRVPESGGTDIPVNTSISITFDQNVSEHTLSGISVVNQSSGQAMSSTATLEERTITVATDQLNFDTTYEITIPEAAVRNSDQVGNAAVSWAFTTIVDVPESVVLATPQMDEGNVSLKPELQWKSADRATSYHLQVSPKADFSTILIDTDEVNQTQFSVDRQLLDYQTYYWRVRGQNVGGNGPWSEPRSFVTRAQAPVLAFPSDQEQEISIAPTLTWNSSYNQTQYRVQVSTSSHLKELRVDSLTDQLQMDLQNLAADQTYYWRVKVESEQTESGWSEEFEFTTRPDPETEEQDPVDVTFVFTDEQQGENGETTSTKVEDKDYRLIGIPGADQHPLDEIFTGKYKDDWRAFFETGDTKEYYEEYHPKKNRMNFKAGTGYWVLSKQLQELQGKLKAVQTNENDTYGVPVHPGWNIISNPYQSTVEWSNVKVENPTLSASASIFGYAQQFNESTTLEPFQAYYFYNDPSLDMDTLFIPYTQIEKRQDQVPQVQSINNDQAGRMVLKAQFSTQDRSMITIQYPEGGAHRTYYQYHPDLNMAKQGLLIKDDNQQRIGYKRISDQYLPDGQEYTVQLKAEVGQKVPLELSSEKLSDRASVLLVNPVTHQSYLLDSVAPEKVITVTEPLMTFTTYVGDRTDLQEIQERLLPEQIQLEPNYPNPFNPITTIRYSIPEVTDVQLEVYNVLGQCVQTLVSEQQQAGWHFAQFNGSQLASGMYIYRLRADDKVHTQKMILLK